MSQRMIISYPAFRLFGAALALAASDPSSDGTGLSTPAFTVILVCFALWAAAPVVRRPILSVHRWHNQLARHRNTLFAGICTLVAADGHPPLWLMIADAALLLGYLLALDAVAAGPVGIRQLRAGWPVGVAAAGTALVLALARLCTGNQSGTLAASGRWLAAGGAILASVALGLAFLPRRTEAEKAASAAKAAGAPGRPPGSTPAR